VKTVTSSGVGTTARGDDDPPDAVVVDFCQSTDFRGPEVVVAATGPCGWLTVTSAR
jgi:hypothetical protein